MRQCDQEYLAVDYFFKELDSESRAKYRRHLAGCSMCQEHVRSLAATDRLVRQHRRPVPESALLRQYQLALAQRFASTVPARRWLDRVLDAWLRRPSIAIRLAEAVLLVLLGFLFGISRNWLPDRQPAPMVAQDTHDLFAIESPLLKNYLQQTEMILLDVKNLDPVEDQQLILNLIQSAQYRYLLQKTLLLREQAQEVENVQLAELLNRIELILLELENVGMSGDVEILSLIQQQLRDTRLLFQIKAINPEGI